LATLSYGTYNSINNVLLSQQGMSSLLYQIHFNIILISPFLLFSFLDFPGPAALPEYLHVEDLTKSLIGHPV